MHAPSTSLNTKSTVKPTTIVYFVAQLHTCPHAEPDKTISLLIVHILVHYTMVNVSRFRMQPNTVKRLGQT